MEYVVIDKEGLNTVNQQINDLMQYVDAHTPSDKNDVEGEWIENKALACRLNVSLRTLQSYRERGVLGFTVIERKIFYKISDVQALIDKGYVCAKNK